MSDEIITPVRATFNEEFFATASDFADALLTHIPELQSVAVVPSWVIPQEHVPFGLIKGRGGRLRHGTEILKMLYQLHGCYQSELNRALEFLSAFDKRAGDLATEIDAKTQELARLELALAGARQTHAQAQAAGTRGASPGDPPADPGPPGS